MVIHRELDQLNPLIQSKAASVIAQLNAEFRGEGVQFIPWETRRELAVQMAYYSRGRMPVEDVRAMYKAAGLYALSDAEAVKMITWTLDSKHLAGLAIDIAPSKDGRDAWWKAPDQYFKRLAEVGELFGFKAGYRWPEPKKDGPHLEV